MLSILIIIIMSPLTPSHGAITHQCGTWGAVGEQYSTHTYVWDVPAYRRGSRCLTPQTHRVETQYSRTARLAHVSNILRVQTHSNPLTVKTYFSITLSGNRV